VQHDLLFKSTSPGERGALSTELTHDAHIAAVSLYKTSPMLHGFAQADMPPASRSSYANSSASSSAASRSCCRIASSSSAASSSSVAASITAARRNSGLHAGN